jgi:hypothetical protein
MKKRRRLSKPAAFPPVVKNVIVPGEGGSLSAAAYRPAFWLVAFAAPAFESVWAAGAFMAMTKLPVWLPATTGYRDAWSAIRAMPTLALYALLTMFAVGLAEYIVPVRAVESVVVSIVLGFVVSAAQNFFLTPIMIAVHRYIILDETAPRYVLEPGQRTFRVFFGWLMALSTLRLLTNLFFAPNDLPMMISAVVVLVAMVFIIVVTIRLSILFPAIAVDAPGAIAANAWADSRGHTFYIFLIFLLAGLPIIVGLVLFTVPFAINGMNRAVAFGLLTIVISIVMVFVLVLYVAIASRLYQALADRLLRGA